MTKTYCDWCGKYLWDRRHTHFEYWKDRLGLSMVKGELCKDCKDSVVNAIEVIRESKRGGSR